MKKILLCLFLLTSLSFYAQVLNMVHCFGDTSFDLTSQKTLLIGNLNPDETTVSYHLTSADATNGVNAISNPTNFISTAASKSIYARINHLGDITTNYFSLIMNPVLIATAVIKPIDCTSNGTITVTASGGTPPYFYTVNNDPVNYSSNIFDNLVAGIYNIKFRDASNCITNGSWTIEPSSIIPLGTPTTTVTNANCKGSNDGTITINASGGKSPLNYSIDNGINYVLNNTFTNLVPGNYAISVKDANNGCIRAISTQVTEPTLLQMAAVITKPINCLSNATVTLNTTGGTSPYTYSKDGIAFFSSNSFSNLTAGTYFFWVKDSKGCIFQNVVTITPSMSLNSTITKTDVSCYGNNDGVIIINASGGQSPYKYTLENNAGIPIISNQSTNVFSGLSAGSYQVKATDANGCLNLNMASIVQPSSPLYATCSVKNQTITINATGGAGIYKYAISPDLNTFSDNNVFSELTPASYTVFIKDVNGCSIMMYVIIDPTTPLGTDDFIIKDLTYFPNPVKNIFTISNSSIIDEITIISIKGETILTKQINSLRSEINLSNFSKGVYFLKVKAEGTEKTVKLIKE